MTDSLLTVRGLVKEFDVGRRRSVRAVDGVSFELAPGEILGLVGESGCGKSTTARCVLRLIEPTAGTVVLDGQDMGALRGSALRRFSRVGQMVFQDPYSSLNPRQTIENVIGEGIDIHRRARDNADRRRRIVEVLERVGLPPSVLHRHPGAFSGGQRQRIGIARALAVEPKLLVCDEPVASLDVSIRAQILNLFADLRDQLGLAILFIAHDLASVRYLCDRVAVMDAGRIIETGSIDDVYDRPTEELTRALIAATPVPDVARERERRLASRAQAIGDRDSSSSPASG